MRAKARPCLLPKLSRGGILLVDADTQILAIHSNLANEEFVGQKDRLFLVVRSQREIAKHFKHGLMTRSETDLEVKSTVQTNVVQVVVLAASANTQLRGGQLPMLSTPL